MSHYLETIALISSLLSGLRHELSNWATVLNLDVDLLEQQTNLQLAPGPDGTAVMELKVNLSDLSQLLTRLRAYPMPGTRFTPVNLHHVVLSAVEYLSNPALPSIHCRLPTQSTWVNADEMSLHRVMVSLLENAQEASERCDRQPIELAVQPIESQVLVTISDRGPGFVDSDLEIDSPFLPGYTTKINNGFLRGLGLGLFVSRAIVELHGGTIRLQNRPGGGAVVTVTLPRLMNYAGDWDTLMDDR
ncbi:MAG: ATP-binding protein [Aggregatilineales bacterium]